MLKLLIVPSAFAAEFSPYQIAERCFPDSRFESVSTIPVHDEKNKDYARNLYYGILLGPKRSAIVFARAEMGSAVAKVLEMAAVKGVRFSPCFDEATAKELRAEMKASGPRYEHQKAVSLIDVELSLPGK